MEINGNDVANYRVIVTAEVVTKTPSVCFLKEEGKNQGREEGGVKICIRKCDRKKER
jgi:hypothetical protein